MSVLQEQALKQQPLEMQKPLAVPRVNFKQNLSQTNEQNKLAGQNRDDSIRQVQQTRPSSTWTTQSAKEALGELKPSVNAQRTS